MTIHARYDSRCIRCGCAILSGAEIDWVRGVGAAHVTPVECGRATANRDIRRATAPRLSLAPLVAFIKAAQERGLKRPSLRVLALDGTTELTISLTVKGRVPGSLAVVLGGRFVGCVRPDGMLTGALVLDAALQAHLVHVSADPAAAAKRYAVLKCRCSFCGLELTDAGSVEVGYGPVCARNWGLPHRPTGTPALVSSVAPVGAAPVEARL